MHTVDEMVILQLPKSALSLSLSLPRASPVGSPLTFISSLQRAPLFTKVYGAPPLPSAGVCQMSPDVGNSIGLHDAPFFTSQRAPAECRAPVSYILVRPSANAHPRSGVSHQYAVNTRPVSDYLRPKSNFAACIQATEQRGAGRRVGLNKQQRGVACVWQR